MSKIDMCRLIHQICTTIRSVSGTIDSIPGNKKGRSNGGGRRRKSSSGWEGKRRRVHAWINAMQRLLYVSLTNRVRKCREGRGRGKGKEWKGGREDEWEEWKSGRVCAAAAQRRRRWRIRQVFLFLPYAIKALSHRGKGKDKPFVSGISGLCSETMNGRKIVKGKDI
jgi:hypothetical protein